MHGGSWGTYNQREYSHFGLLGTKVGQCLSNKFVAPALRGRGVESDFVLEQRTRLFLVEGGDDLGLEPPPGSDIYLFSEAPVGGALKAGDHLPVSQPWLGHGLSALLDRPR